MEAETNPNVTDDIQQIVIDFGNICRFCLIETTNKVSIHDKCFNQEKDCDTILDFVTKISSIQLDNLDGFPSLVCENCCNVIRMCFEFRESCRQSELSLRDCYERTLAEAKAKFLAQCEGIQKENKAEVLIKQESVAPEQIMVKVEDCLFSCDQFSEISGESSRLRKRSLLKRDSLSVLKAGTIEQKYQRINSLSERLKEAQSKLVEDILRTKDIMSVKEENAGKLRFSCAQCQMCFMSSEMLTYHFITSHVADNKNQRTFNVFHCKLCKKEFGFMYQLMRHYKTAHKIPMSKLSTDHLAPKNVGYKNFQCLDCNPVKTFSKRKNFLRHLAEHAKEMSAYMCLRCDSNQTFATKFSLNRHLMNIHKMERNEIGDGVAIKEDKSELKLLKIHVCVDCSPPVSFSDVAQFISHKSDTHNRKLENISLKELTPVYVESVNVFEPENRQTFKVICKSCEKPEEFFSASGFVQHMKTHHEDVPNEKWEVETKYLLDAVKLRDRIWKCPECPASYIRKHSLHHHLRDKHNQAPRSGGIECPDCKTSFLTNKQVIQHGLTVHGKYFANLHKVFKDKILQDPSETDRRIRNFECDICQKKYLGKTSLKRHILKTHLGKAETETAICSYCGKTFSNNLNLKSHIDFVHEALFVSCPICKKNINFKTIGKHYKIHQASADYHSKNRFLCNECGRVLKSKSGFDDHQKLHLNVRDQICDICGSGFTTKKNLYIHKKAHDVAHKKLFQCDQCSKVFTGKHTLNRHLLTHSGEKNFICEICSKCFYTLQELNRHVRYHKKEYRFDCQMCDMRFLDRSRFRHHMMRHRNIRPHKCHFCEKVFIVRRKMNLHMAARHNVEVQNTKAVWKDPKTYIPLDDLL